MDEAQVQASLKELRISRRTAKGSLTRAGKALKNLIENGRSAQEVSESLVAFKRTFDDLVTKHEKFTQLIEDDKQFDAEEIWMEENHDMFMDLEIQAKLYIESLP